MAACGGASDFERKLKRPSKLADILQKLHKTADSDGDCAIPDATSDEATATASPLAAASPYAASPRPDDDHRDSALPSNIAPASNPRLADTEKKNGSAVEGGELLCGESERSEEGASDLIGCDAELTDSSTDHKVGGNVTSGSGGAVLSSGDDIDFANENRDIGVEGMKEATASDIDAWKLGGESLLASMSKGRSSRRKQQKTRKVVESDDENSQAELTYIPPISSADVSVDPAACVTADSREEECSSSVEAQGSCAVQDVSVVGVGEDSKMEEHELADFVLPEGTVFVQPEDVDSSPPSLELQSRYNKTFKGFETAIINCTACSRQLGTEPSTEVHRHPVLKVLICKKCYTTYTESEIEQDAEGSDEQCRWCVQRGDLICCDFCHNALCKACIRRNLGRRQLNDILDSDDAVKWKCYICDPKPLLSLIDHCSAVMEALARQERKESDRRRRVEAARSRPEPGPGGVLPPGFASVSPRSTLRPPNPVSFRPVPNPVQPRGASSHGFRVPVVVPPIDSSKSVFIPAGNSRKGFYSSTAPPVHSVGVALHARRPGGRYRMASPLESQGDRSVSVIVDRLLSSTQSMALFLDSLSSELRTATADETAGGVGADGVFTPTMTRRRRDIASKLHRAYRTYTDQFQSTSGLVALSPETKSVGTYKQSSGVATQASSKASAASGNDPGNVLEKPVVALSKAGLSRQAPRNAAMNPAASRPVAHRVSAIVAPAGAAVGKSGAKMWAKAATATVTARIDHKSAVMQTAAASLRSASSPHTAVVPTPTPVSNKRKRSNGDREVIELSDSDEELARDAESITGPMTGGGRPVGPSVDDETTSGAKRACVRSEEEGGRMVTDAPTSNHNGCLS